MKKLFMIAVAACAMASQAGTAKLYDVPIPSAPWWCVTVCEFNCTDGAGRGDDFNECYSNCICATCGAAHGHKPAPPTQ